MRYSAGGELLSNYKLGVDSVHIAAIASHSALMFLMGGLRTRGGSGR